MATSGLDYLPTELLRLISTHLTAREQARLSQVNRRLNAKMKGIVHDTIMAVVVRQTPTSGRLWRLHLFTMDLWTPALEEHDVWALSMANRAWYGLLRWERHERKWQRERARWRRSWSTDEFQHLLDVTAGLQ